MVASNHAAVAKLKLFTTQITICLLLSYSALCVYVVHRNITSRHALLQSSTKTMHFGYVIAGMEILVINIDLSLSSPDHLSTLQKGERGCSRCY